MKKEKGILDTVDGLDSVEIIIAIENSFNIKFDDERDFEEVKTYGEFENLVLDKVQGTEMNDCTSQQSFYKLREILVEDFNIPFKNITPKSQLNHIFPSKNRIKNVTFLKDKLKTETNFLKPDFTLSFISVVLIILSFYYFFNQFLLGLLLFVIGIFCAKIAQDFGKEFYVTNIGKLSEFMVKKDYKNSRRNSETYNPREVKEIIKEIFSDMLDIEKSKLQYNTIL